MNILVTGANGQLGRTMRVLSNGSADRYIFTDVVAPDGLETRILDITDKSAVRSIVDQEGIKAIINCAAFTNVDAAESSQDLAETLNAVAPGILAGEMARVGGLLVHVSTDYVFGKEPYNTPCTEDRKGTPTGVYGLTKLHGEQRILESGCKYLIFRTAWLYSEWGKNFCKTMLSLTGSKDSIKVVFDQAGTPTYAGDLGAAIYRVVTERLYEGREGIYNYSNEGVCSWFDFARAVYVRSKQAGLIPAEHVCEVSPCHSSEFPSPVTRPAYSVLDKTKVKETFGVKVPYWTDSLDICIENLKKL